MVKIYTRLSTGRFHTSILVRHTRFTRNKLSTYISHGGDTHPRTLLPSQKNNSATTISQLVGLARPDQGIIRTDQNRHEFSLF
jgi:hypothetical protein